jgi:hypothetical protein
VQLPVDKLEKNWLHLPMRRRRDIIRNFFTITVVPAEKRGGRTGKLLIEPV